MARKKPATPSKPVQAPPPPRRPRWHLVAAIVVLAAAGGAGWWWFSRARPVEIVRTADQNVLLITIDTLRADALGSYGGAAETPNLDALAADGMRFEFAHAHAVLTLPSHVSILSGVYPFQHGVRDNSGFRVSPGTVTAATLLKQQGFATAAFIGGYPLDGQFGLDPGFDLYDDRLDDVAQSSEFVLAERRADAVVKSALAWLEPRHDALVRVGARVRSARAVRAARAVRDALRVEPLRGRGGLRRRRARPAAREGAGGDDTADAGHRHGRSRRGARRSRRGDARRLRLRGDAPRAAASSRRSAGRRPAGSGGPGRSSPTPVQHVDILPTILDGLGLHRAVLAPGRSLLKPMPRRGRARVVLRGAVDVAQPRVGAAPRRARRARQVHRPARSRSSTTSGAIRRRPRICSDAQRRRAATLGGAAHGIRADRSGPATRRECRDGRAPAGAGVRVRLVAGPEEGLHRERRSEAAHPARPADAPRARAVSGEADARGRDDLPRAGREPARHDALLPPPRVHALGAGARRRGDRDTTTGACRRGQRRRGGLAPRHVPLGDGTRRRGAAAARGRRDRAVRRASMR